MGKIYCLLGSTCSGKSLIHREILKDVRLHLISYVMHTTRPIRKGERDGVDAIFVKYDRMRQLVNAGVVVSMIELPVVSGVWHYFFTSTDIDLSVNSYIACVGSLDLYNQIVGVYGSSAVPIYIDSDDRSRLLRYIERESYNYSPNYSEVCRRFLSDKNDYSNDRIKKSNIRRRFINEDLDVCVREISDYILSIESGE